MGFPLRPMANRLYRAVSKRLVPTNVDMYRMYRNRDRLLHGRSQSSAVPDDALDTRTADQAMRQLLIRGSYNVLRTKKG